MPGVGGPFLRAAHVRTVNVPDADRRELQRRARDRGAPARVVERARIVLLAAEGVPGQRIAELVGCAEGTVVTWRGRYAERGLAGLADLPRPGKPSPLPEELRDRVLELTLTEPPTAFGATHWSSRLLVAALAGEGTPISHATIARIWHRFGVQPWRARTFKFSTDPALEAKIRDVVGLYLHPPEKAVVLCVDEKPQIQALQRTAPTLPVRPGHPAAASFDYVRHGTTTLFAPLAVPTGKVTDACTERHRPPPPEYINGVSYGPLGTVDRKSAELLLDTAAHFAELPDWETVTLLDVAEHARPTDNDDSFAGLCTCRSGPSTSPSREW